MFIHGTERDGPAIPARLASPKAPHPGGLDAKIVHALLRRVRAPPEVDVFGQRISKEAAQSARRVAVPRAHFFG